MGTAVSRIINELKKRGGLRGTDLANVAKVSRATVSRWSTGKSIPHPKTQTVIADLNYVVNRLADLYTPDESRLWLYSMHPMLGGERAIELIHAGRTEEVLEVIERLDAGAYV